MADARQPYGDDGSGGESWGQASSSTNWTGGSASDGCGDHVAEYHGRHVVDEQNADQDAEEGTASKQASPSDQA